MGMDRLNGAHPIWETPAIAPGFSFVSMPYVARGARWAFSGILMPPQRNAHHGPFMAAWRNVPADTYCRPSVRCWRYGPMKFGREVFGPLPYRGLWYGFQTRFDCHIAASRFHPPVPVFVGEGGCAFISMI